MLGSYSEPPDGHDERRLQLVGKLRHGAPHIVRATRHLFNFKAKLLDRTGSEIVRQADDASFGPCDDVVVTASITIVEGTSLKVAGPFRDDAGDECVACKRVEGGEETFDVGA